MNVLGVNAVFHDPAAAIVVDGRTVAAAEEERFSRRKHGKPAVPFSTWELPEHAIRFCLRTAGLRADELDVVTYSYDPSLAPSPGGDLPSDGWEGLRTLYAARAGHFLHALFPALDPDVVRHVPHHVAHAASAYLAAPFEGECSVLTLDGRGERQTMLAGRVRGGDLEVLAEQTLPHSLGLLYERLTEHVGFTRATDEYKVMALAAYGEPRWIEELREAVYVRADGGFVAPVDLDLGRFCPPLAHHEDDVSRPHADLAATVQTRLEEVLLELARWLQQRTGDRRLAMAGGTALNCVANSRLWREGPFSEVWVQPAAGDAGTALGGALYAAHAGGDVVRPFTSAALGTAASDASIEVALRHARYRYERPDDLAEVVADVLARGGIVGLLHGRAEFGPRALGHRSLLASPTDPGMTERLNVVKGREQFRPVAPLVLEQRAADVFTDGPLPSPYMLFTHTVRADWLERIPAAVHVDKTARAQTVSADEHPVLAAVLRAFERRTGVPVLINTSFNTAGRPMVDTPEDALECFGASPIDLLVLGPFVVRRTEDR